LISILRVGEVALNSSTKPARKTWPLEELKLRNGSSEPDTAEGGREGGGQGLALN
jgi:hypothetical protein